MNSILKYRFKMAFKKIIRKAGYDIQTVESNYYYQITKVLSFKKINLIIDVGANIGQFSSEIRAAGFKGKIISIEPIQSCNSKLKILSNFDRNWIVLEPMAIGNSEGNIEINISKNYVSSSILSISDAHLNAENNSLYFTTQKVEIKQLDQAVEKYVNSDSNIMLKIDTQGYEFNVLEGAAKILKIAKVVVMELSILELYEKQKLSDEMVIYMRGHGFEMWNTRPEFFNQDGKAIQYDALFVRE